jgi:hypothetical protein
MQVVLAERIRDTSTPQPKLQPNNPLHRTVKQVKQMRRTLL